MFDITAVTFDERGLVPVIAQDAETGRVLMLAYANDEALMLTQATGELHFWSRSRQEIWHKGATSGNVQRLRALRFDCDYDALLALVEPAGPACHTGEVSCFDHAGQNELEVCEVLAALADVIAARKEETQQGKTSASYTTKLLTDPSFAAAKVLEEADEVAAAVKGETDRRVDEEAADLLYHLLVLIATRDRTITNVLEVLRERRK